jgi:hypothetical protein
VAVQTADPRSSGVGRDPATSLQEISSTGGCRRSGTSNHTAANRLTGRRCGRCPLVHTGCGSTHGPTHKAAKRGSKRLRPMNAAAQGKFRREGHLQPRFPSKGVSRCLRHRLPCASRSKKPPGEGGAGKRTFVVEGRRGDYDRSAASARPRSSPLGFDCLYVWAAAAEVLVVTTGSGVLVWPLLP